MDQDRHPRPSRRVLLCGVVVAAVAVGMLAPLPAVADTQAQRTEKRRPKTQVTSAAPGQEATSLAAQVTQAVAATSSPVQWPPAASATVAVPSDSAAVRRGLGMSRVGGAPVWVGSADGAAVPKSLQAPAGTRAVDRAPASVRVQLADRAAAARAGVDGLLLHIWSADAARSGGTVAVRVDYSGFGDAYGGDWATRLRLVQLPTCALTDAASSPCRTPAKTLQSVNDPVGDTVTGLVQFPAVDQGILADSGAGTVAVPAGADVLLALTAGVSSTSGDWSATSLSASGNWQAGGSGGDLNWSYPLRTPPVPGDLAPALAITYSSSDVDGRTTSANNQPSGVGEGFELATGFVERRYAACPDDMSGGNNSGKTGDLCWKTDNATISFGGRAGELVKDTADADGDGNKTEWRLRFDDGTRVEKLTGGFNTDDDGEYWKLTSTDGTQYFFGKGKTSSAATEATRSAWIAPVYGNHSGEPCHATAFKDSFCLQAWRWNLDHVIDTHGNTITYYYTNETNRYGRNLNRDGATSSYDRGGYLSRIDYGERSGAEHTTTAPAAVAFAVADRCFSTCSSQTATSWPDVPNDQICTSTTSCPSVLSPAFFTKKRLTTITTKTWSGTAYTTVDTWSLTQSFPDPGDGTTAALVLDGIQDMGLGGPKTTFNRIQMDNRVDGLDNAPPLIKWRVYAINSESGATLSFTYSTRDCSPANVPAPESNSKRCFPVYWTPEGQTTAERHWFHKYRIDEVVEQDRSGASTWPVVTRYTYLDAPAWHYTESELIPAKYRTWSEFRGFGRVRAVTGETGTIQSRIETLYFRGMDGDRASAGGGTKTVNVTDSEGVASQDHWRLAGMPREVITYNGPTGGEVSGTITEPWRSAATADNGSNAAMLAQVGTDRTRTALSAGGYRRTEKRTTFDSYGLPKDVNDLGTVSADDDLCTRYTYARNTTAWILDTVSRTETVSTSCSEPSPNRPDQVVSDARSYYDGGGLGAAPTKGDETKTDTLDVWMTGPVYATSATASYDSYGRATSTCDPLSRCTSTAYTQTVGLLTKTVVTTPDPDGAGPLAPHVTSTAIDPRWGVPTAVTDPNGKVTTAAYDNLGRLTKVWLPGRATSLTPNLEYAYTIRQNGPNAVTTKTLSPAGVQLSGIDIYDGLMRKRQTQKQTLDSAGGTARTISDTTYDSRGLTLADRGPAFATGAPATTVYLVDDANMPSQTVHTYDGASRETVAAFQVLGVEKWRTTTTYGGDRVSVDPPAGAIPTTTISDPRGRSVELRRYTGSAPSGAYDATTYTYRPDGKPATVRDVAGNEWSYSYDLRGRQIHAVDPDKGTATSRYDVASQLISTTDARGVTLAYTYDALGRKTTLRDTSVTGVKRAEWIYDTYTDTNGASAVMKGQQTKSIRYSGGAAYTNEITGFDNGYRPTSTTMTIPSVAGEVGLAGTYKTIHTYNVDSSPASFTLQGKGGLSSETVSYTYDAVGRTDTMGGSGAYVSDTIYSPFGEPLQLTMGNTLGKAIWQTLTYEPGTRRRLTSQLDREVVPTYDSLTTYGYDLAGNITSIKDAPHSSTGDTQCFRYDYLQQLTDAWTPGSGECTTGPTTAGLDGPAPYWKSWAFTPTGNRLTQTTHTSLGDTTATSSYPPPGDTGPHAVSSTTTAGPDVNKTDTYGYDSAGNTTSRDLNGVAQTLTYDPEGHLQKVTHGASTLEDNLYDAEGNRLIRREPGSSRTTLFWGTHTEITLNTSTGGITGTRYYEYAGHTIATRIGIAQADVTTLVPDHRGTASYAVADTTGVLSVRRLDPFGNPRGTPPASWPGQRGYVNGTLDNAVGLTHLGARDYDPALGRFLSVDPLVDISQPETLNAYTYSNNSPVTLSDPHGTRPMDAGTGGELPVKPLKAWAKTNNKALAHRSAPPSAEERQRQHIIGAHSGKRTHGGGSSGSFDFSVSYITDEILRNSDSPTATSIRIWLQDRSVVCLFGMSICDVAFMLDVLGPGDNSLRYDAALATWATKVRSGGDWDHKRPLQRIFGHEGENFYMRLPDTDKSVSFDLWSNIHYGYVGTDVGFSANTLQAGANLGNTIPPLRAVAGTNDRFDEVAIQIGIDLRHQYATQDLTAEAVRSTVLSRLPELEAAMGRHVQPFDPGNPRMEP